MLVGTAGNVKVVFCGSARKRKQAGTVMIYMDNAATTMRKPKEVIEAVTNAMQCMGNAGRGAHCAPLMHEAFGTVEQGAVRFSFSHYNTEEEVETAIQAIRELSEE